ncbi:MAG: DEAD/DEAH box helicase [Hahellaceae bacterium]|nr:DEAD/DEAH box helicase [Hahellaceae bacterium]
MFSSFHLHERLLKALSELAFTEPTPVQAQAIPAAMAGHNLLVTAQTGSGKTAAFLLPTLHRLLTHPATPAQTRVWIVLPTRELARQTLEQVEQFAKFTFLKACLLGGGEDFRVQASQLRRVPDIVVGTPGRMVEHLETGSLLPAQVDILILDEADRMLDMGFAEAVEKIAKACSARRQTLLFSATRGGAALKGLRDTILPDAQDLQLNAVHELNAETRQQVITSDHTSHKDQQLLWLLQNETFAKAIIFANKRTEAERLFRMLSQRELKVYVLHGDKDQKERNRALASFRTGQDKVMVATDVAARGLDIEGLDLVVNYDIPRSGSDYLHRIGRTGRGGEAGLAISFVTPNDWNLMCSIERYLKQAFERRNLQGLKARYQGPPKNAAKKKKQQARKVEKQTRGGPVKPKSIKPKTKPAPAAVAIDGFAPMKRKAAKDPNQY